MPPVLPAVPICSPALPYSAGMFRQDGVSVGEPLSAVVRFRLRCSVHSGALLRSAVSVRAVVWVQLQRTVRASYLQYSGLPGFLPSV